MKVSERIAESMTKRERKIVILRESRESFQEIHRERLRDRE